MAPMQKNTLRQQMKRTRQRMTPDQRRRYSEAISAAVVQSTDWANATVIGLYASFRNEVDTWALMEQVRLSGKQLALPKVVSPQTPLSFYHVTRNDGTWTLEAGAFGVMEPNASCPEIPRAALICFLFPHWPYPPKDTDSAGAVDITTAPSLRFQPVVPMPVRLIAKLSRMYPRNRTISR